MNTPSEVIFATTNEGKLREVKQILGDRLKITPPPKKLKVKEEGKTFLENAYIKAITYYKEFKTPVLSEDSGLVVPSLGGYPGIYSSRFYEIEFGGKEEVKGSRDEANVRKLLRLLKGKKDRSAFFFCCFFLILDENTYFSSFGKVEGRISEEVRGRGGFGYDPVFIPEGHKRTFAQMKEEEKNSLSHRRRALENLLKFLR